MLHRAIFLTLAAVIGSCAACGSSDPGAVVALPPAPAVGTTTPGPTLVIPTPTVHVGASSLAGAAAPALRDMFTTLNQNTAETARGEYVLIEQLSGALRTRIESLLNNVPRS